MPAKLEGQRKFVRVATCSNIHQIYVSRTSVSAPFYYDRARYPSGLWLTFLMQILLGLIVEEFRFCNILLRHYIPLIPQKIVFCNAWSLEQKRKIMIDCTKFFRNRWIYLSGMKNIESAGHACLNGFILKGPFPLAGNASSWVVHHAYLFMAYGRRKNIRKHSAPLKYIRVCVVYSNVIKEIIER